MHAEGIMALPVRGGEGSQPLPHWSMASIVALKIDAKSGPECPFEYGGVQKLFGQCSNVWVNNLRGGFPKISGIWGEAITEVLWNPTN